MAVILVSRLPMLIVFFLANGYNVTVQYVQCTVYITTCGCVYCIEGDIQACSLTEKALCIEFFFGRTIVMDWLSQFLCPTPKNPFCPWTRLSTQVFFPYLWVYYQDQESKCGDIWQHTGPPSAPGLMLILSWISVRSKTTVLNSSSPFQKICHGEACITSLLVDRQTLS